jgi:hypothetical protein
MAKLSWNDLIIQDMKPADCADWLRGWSHLTRGRVAPVFMSKFGDWFLRGPDGSTIELSVIEGTMTAIAKTTAEFSALVNSQQWQEVHLLSLLVLQLHERALIPGSGHCYGFTPHPAFTGRIELNSAVVLDIPVWQSICAQTFAAAGRTKK